ncbi:uncharacterized protein J8A68_004679 [[Candida] subhashii]|uniref:F-box domain-containing protein n=1 Tax=[Candida] subhashii TaxID=561895 RepID=A0A8J5UUN3_9ASCO|nr:uncharacterized protein J8A68_004679 [[Candida] subhashii]KAG7661790.1 hypothetical protein J8A68_004679 [[Candida] subhashii]
MTSSEIPVLKILSLPLEVLDLVFTYIPTVNLLSYDIPILSTVLENALKERGITCWIDIQPLGLLRSDMYDTVDLWRREPIGDETMLKSEFDFDINCGSHMYFGQPDGIERFANFMTKHPNVKPELVIVGVRMMEQLHAECPSCLRNVRDVSLWEGNHDDEATFLEIVSRFPYPIDSLVPFDRLGDFSLPASVRSLHINHFPEFDSPLVSDLRESDLMSLEIDSLVDADDLRYLPKGLKKLEILLELDSPSCTPDLPSTLECLKIRCRNSAELTELNLSNLKKLKQLSLTKFDVLKLASLSASKEIEKLDISSDRLVSLESIERYTMLKDLSLLFFGIGDQSILDSSLPVSLQVLSVNWWYTDQELVSNSNPEKSTVNLPSNLKRLNISADSPLVCEKEWGFPASLRILSLDVPILPKGFQIPPNLITLSIQGCDLGCLPLPLPKSLIRLRTSVPPPNKSYLKHSKNLTYLRFDFTGTGKGKKNDIYAFAWELPSSLRKLKVHQSWITDLKLNSPKLKAVELNLGTTSDLKEFKLPNTVEGLRLLGPSPHGHSKLPVSEQVILPTHLKSLHIKFHSLYPNSLPDLRLNTFKDLWYLNLHGCKISKLENGTFPNSIEVLNLSNNPLEEIYPYVFKNLPNLRFLFLRTCWLGRLALEHPLEFSSSLKYLNLVDNELEDIDRFNIPPDNSLMKIELTFNNFPDKEAILQALRTQVGHEVSIVINEVDYVNTERSGNQ